MSFNIQRFNRDTFQILTVDGYMGNDEWRKLETELERLLANGHRHVIVDFAALTFITSESLLRLAKLVESFQQKHGSLRPSALPTSMARLVKLARLEDTLNAAADLAAAIKSLPAIKHVTCAKTKAHLSKESLRRASNNRKTPAAEPS